MKTKNYLKEINSIYIEEIENIEDLDKDSFKDLYHEANEKLEKIIKLFEDEVLIRKMEKYNEYPNNIISFVGERGSGKTSMMLNFAKFKEKEAYVLDLIEPELMENEINLLEIIVSKLYIKFQKKYTDLNIEKNFREIIRELNLKFLEMIKDIKIYFEKREEYDHKESSENLFEISNVLNLKGKFKNLIESYIKIMNQLSNKNFKYLIILIDDMDLNFENTYLVLEQLRKFLVVPKLVNIIAYKESQLINILENKFLETEKYEVTEKYLKKLFPYENQIYTPTKEDILIYYNDEFLEEFKTKIFKNIKEENNIEEIIHEFYPETLREALALKKFFRISKANIDSYIKFLGGKYLSEINTLKKNKQYLKLLFEINQELKNDKLSVEEIKMLILKKEYILFLASKNKNININILRKILPITFSYSWGKKYISMKDEGQLVDKKIFEYLKDEIELLSAKNKKDILEFLSSFIKNNKMSIWNLFDKYGVQLDFNEAIRIINEINIIIDDCSCQTLEELFEILKINQDIYEKVKNVINIIKSKPILKEKLELIIFLPSFYFNFIKIKTISDLEDFFSDLYVIKNYSNYLPSIGIKEQIESFNFIEYLSDFQFTVEEVFVKISELKADENEYIRKIIDSILFVKFKELEIEDIKINEKTELRKNQKILEVTREIVSNILDLNSAIKKLINNDFEENNLYLPDKFLEKIYNNIGEKN